MKFDKVYVDDNIFYIENFISKEDVAYINSLMEPHRKKEKDFSLLIKIEHSISPYVAFGIMPLFAFANAGVSTRLTSFNTAEVTSI